MFEFFAKPHMNSALYYGAIIMVILATNHTLWWLLLSFIIAPVSGYLAYLWEKEHG